VDGELIGRGVELAQLVSWWGDAAQGRGGVAVVRGVAGIGKTALLEALRREVENSGHCVHFGKSDELEMARPFRVLSQAVGSDAEDRWSARSSR